MFDRILRRSEREGKLAVAEWVYNPPAAGITNSTSDVAAKAAVAAQFHHVTGAIVTGQALANASTLVVKDGATVLARIGLPTGSFGPLQVSFPVSLRGSANTAVNIAVEAVFATGALLVTLTGYTTTQ